MFYYVISEIIAFLLKSLKVGFFLDHISSENLFPFDADPDPGHKHWTFFEDLLKFSTKEQLFKLVELIILLRHENVKRIHRLMKIK